MKWLKRYRGLPFTREHVEEIGTLLGLEHHHQACFAAESIARGLTLYHMSYVAKTRMGSTDKLKDKLTQIANAAAHLSKLLEDETVCDAPFDGFWQATGVPEFQSLDRQPLWRDTSVSRGKLQNLIDDLATSTGKLASSDRLMRGYYFLPPIHEANNNLETSIIWPMLFVTWEQHDKQVAGSVNGTNKLHRFVNLTHDAVGLGTPSVNTLNRAIQRWKQDPRRHRPENAAWYFGGDCGNTDAIGEA